MRLRGGCKRTTLACAEAAERAGYCAGFRACFRCKQREALPADARVDARAQALRMYHAAPVRRRNTVKPKKSGHQVAGVEALPLVVESRYDFHEFGGYLGNVGSKHGLAELSGPIRVTTRSAE